MAKPREIGYGIIGCGVIGDNHCRAVKALSDAHLIAVADSIPARAEKMAATYDAAAHADYRALLERDDVDAVSICLPSGMHAEVGVEAAQAGKHILVEKPIDITLEAADRLIAACQAAGVKLAVVSQRRLVPGVQQMRRALEQGRFGRLILGDALVKWYRTQAYYDSGAWRGTWAMDGGGVTMNQSIHSIDLLQWMMGDVVAVTAYMATLAHTIEVEDLSTAILRFRNGALGVIECSTAVYPGLPERLGIHGENGSAIVEGRDAVVWEFRDERGEVGPYGSGGKPPTTHASEPAPAPVDDGHTIQIADLVAAIREGCEPMINGKEARKPLEIILAMYQSARLGREVTLPLTTGGL